MNKQECIPVGCVPSAAVAICWGCLPQCMLEYTPPDLGLDTIPLPWADTSPGPGPRHTTGPGPRHPPPPVNRMTGVKTLPSQTSFADGKDLRRPNIRNLVKDNYFTSYHHVLCYTYSNTLLVQKFLMYFISKVYVNFIQPSPT